MHANSVIKHTSNIWLIQGSLQVLNGPGKRPTSWPWVTGGRRPAHMSLSDRHVDAWCFWGVCFLEDGTATFRGGIARLRKHERYLFAANWCKLMKRWQKLIWKRSWLSLLRIPLCAASAVNWIHVTLVFWMHPQRAYTIAIQGSHKNATRTREKQIELEGHRRGQILYLAWCILFTFIYTTYKYRYLTLQIHLILVHRLQRF